MEMVERTNDFRIVGTSRDGEDAWSLICETWPSILITDIMMPNRDGLWLIEQVHRHGVPLETIIISGYDNFEYARLAMKCGVNEYLLKPVKEEELVAALQSAVHRLEYNRRWHGQVVRFQQLLARVHDDNRTGFLRELEGLLSEICSGTLEGMGFEKGVLSIYSHKFNEMIAGSDPRFKSIELPDTLTPNTVRNHFKQLAETYFLKAAAGMKSFESQAMSHIRHYIEHHYREPYSLNEMAAKANLSVSHFSSLFKKHTGTSLVQYINQIRIGKAKELLLEADLKIYDVAELVGYETLTYFNRLFKEKIGCPPAEYRKRVGL